MSFPERLVERRKSLGISQKELAARLNITPTRLNYWGKGKREPDVFYIKAIAKELGVTGDWLLETGFEDQYRPSLDAFEIAKQYDHLEPDGKRFIQDALQFAQRPSQKASSEPEESWISAKDREEYDEVMKLAKDALKKAHPEGRAMNQK